MSASYKPVLMLSLLDTIDDRGRAKISDLVERFRNFYLERHNEEKSVEKPSITLSRVTELDDSEIQSIIFKMPFEKFERRRYLEYDKRDLAYVRFARPLWQKLRDADLVKLRKSCLDSIVKYYERVDAQNDGKE